MVKLLWVPRREKDAFVTFYMNKDIKWSSKHCTSKKISITNFNCLYILNFVCCIPRAIGISIIFGSRLIILKLSFKLWFSYNSAICTVYMCWGWTAEGLAVMLWWPLGRHAVGSPMWACQDQDIPSFLPQGAHVNWWLQRAIARLNFFVCRISTENLQLSWVYGLNFKEAVGAAEMGGRGSVDVTMQLRQPKGHRLKVCPWCERMARVMSYTLFVTWRNLHKRNT